MNRILPGILICIWFLYPLSILQMKSGELHTLMVIHGIAFVLINVMFMLRKSLKSNFISYMIFVILFILFISGIFDLGLLSIVLILAPFISTLVWLTLGRNTAISFLLLAILISAATIALYLFDLIKPPVINPLHYMNSSNAWSLYITFIIIGLSIAFALLYNPAAQTIEEHEARFNAIFNGVNDAIIVHDAGTGDILDVNKKVIELFGYSRDELLKLKIEDLGSGIYPYIQENAIRLLARARAGKSAIRDWHAKDKTGRLFWMEINLKKTYIGGKEFIIAVERDITARRDAEETLRKSEEMFRILFEHAPAGVCYTGIDGKFIRVNPMLCQITGYSPYELYKITFSEISHPDDVDEDDTLVKKTLKGEIDSFNLQKRYIRKDNSIIWVNLVTSLYRNIKGEPQFFIAIVEDITERLKINEELKNAQKLESLGILAGGIAHDFNNLLGGIFGYIDLAMMDCKDEDTLEYLEKAIHPFKRAKDLSMQLLTFAKGGSPDKKLGSIDKVIIDTTLFALSGSNIKPDFYLEKNIAKCEFDSSQISQVINNIVLNAQQAMPRGGSLKITAINTYLDKGSVPLLNAGRYIKVSVEDKGIGIQPDIISRIFDPFFTTKQKGSGLGLSISYSIARKHDGTITVESRPGKGSLFSLYLPAASKETFADDRKKVKNGHRGNGTIIVMDDEAFMADVVGSMIRSIGYDVICARDGSEVLKFIDETKTINQNINCMILDLTVPGGMGGKELMQELKRKNIEVTAIAASGYADDPVMSNPEQYGFKASMAKPFRKDDLEEKLNIVFAVNNTVGSTRII